MEELRARIRHIREVRRLTVQTAAAAAGIDRRRWRGIEKDRDPRLSELVGIARALGRPPAELLREPGDQRPGLDPEVTAVLERAEEVGGRGMTLEILAYARYLA